MQSQIPPAALAPHAAGGTAAPRKRGFAVLPVVGLLPALVLAWRALTEPWAQARVLFVIGVARSPGATLLVGLSVLITVAASVAVAMRRRHGLAAAVHLALGALLGLVSWAAFRMVRRAGVHLLGVVPIASVHPGSGLQHFRLAAALVAALGMLELVLAARDAHRGSSKLGAVERRISPGLHT